VNPKKKLLFCVNPENNSCCHSEEKTYSCSARARALSLFHTHTCNHTLTSPPIRFFCLGASSRVCVCVCVCVCASARACCNVAETNRIAGGKSLFCLLVAVLRVRVRTRARAHLQTLYAQRGASFSLSLSLAFSLSLARSRALSLALSLSFSHTHTLTHAHNHSLYAQRGGRLLAA